MPNHDPESRGPSAAVAPEEGPRVAVRDTRGRERVWCLTAALLAGLAAWGVGESGLARATAEEADVMLMGHQLRNATAETLLAAEVTSAVVTFASLGAFLGLAVGLAGGFGSDAPRRGVVAGLVGLVVGGAVGASLPLAVVPGYHRLVESGASEFASSFLAHAGIWTPIGAAAGLALGLGTGRGGTKGVILAVLGGVFGSLIAAIGYEVIGTVAFPLDRTGQPISIGTVSRLVARLLVALLSAGGALILADGALQVRRVAKASPVRG